MHTRPVKGNIHLTSQISIEDFDLLTQVTCEWSQLMRYDLINIENWAKTMQIWPRKMVSTIFGDGGLSIGIWNSNVTYSNHECNYTGEAALSSQAVKEMLKVHPVRVNYERPVLACLCVAGNIHKGEKANFCKKFYQHYASPMHITFSVSRLV